MHMPDARPDSVGRASEAYIYMWCLETNQVRVAGLLFSGRGGVHGLGLGKPDYFGTRSTQTHSAVGCTHYKQEWQAHSADDAGCYVIVTLQAKRAGESGKFDKT